MAMSSKQQDFFDENADFYGNVKPQSYDYYFVNFIKKAKGSCLLDIGGGSGTFAKLVKDNCPDIDVTIVDQSEKILSKVNDERIKMVYGKLPRQISLNSGFDYICVKDLFHHVVGASINESKELLRESLFNIKGLLNKDGYLLIHEIFYESYLIPTMSRTLIFYLLALQNKCGFKIPAKEFLMDLMVCFYTRSEFKSILNECGFKIIGTHEEYWSSTFKKRALFLRDWGRMLFIVVAQEGDFD